jgi:transcriptional regulator with PAS, ATPase and Fis domain
MGRKMAMLAITSRIREALQQIAAQTANAFQAPICVISLASSSKPAAAEILSFPQENFVSSNQQELSKLLLTAEAIDKPFSYKCTPDCDCKELDHFPNFLQAQGIKAFVTIPLFSNLASCGTLALFFTAPRNFSENEIQHLIAVGKAAALGVDFDDDKITPNGVYNESFENIVAKSPVMFDVFETMQKAAITDASVLIFGESGTGKELIAHGIHHLSRRKNNAFIPVDCVALPSNLLESELFGFEKGSFTGAIGRKHGLLEFADHGTLFLDEVCELDTMLQAKLLRVLQERQFRRIGSNHLIDVDMRLISATNRKPDLAVSEKVLREDLYFRLNVIPIYAPALRERKDDIPLLANYFIRKFAPRNQIDLKELAVETVQTLREYDWPGNIRELQNTIERVVALCPRHTILPEDLPNEIRVKKMGKTTDSVAQPYTLKTWRENLTAFKRNYFKNLLEQNNGDIPAAARQARVSRRTLYRIAQRYKLL